MQLAPASVRVPDSMNFLNEVVSRFPQAISFGPGRPLDSLLALPMVFSQLELSREPRCGQYGETNGLIREDIASYLSHDEDLEILPEDILVTHGAQEAMLILLLGLFDVSRDVLLVVDPAYVGILGAAQLLGIRTHAVRQTLAGLDPDELVAAIAAVRAHGGVPRAIYHVPTYNNPLGTVMSLETRARLLEIAEQNDLWVFEDTAYAAFSYDSPPPPSLARLDSTGSVIYLGTFSKTLFPGLRVGFLAHRRQEGKADLMKLLGQVKSFTTINTTPVMQIAVAGVLRANGFSLQSIVRPKLAQYRLHRDQMLASLSRHMPAGVSWNHPSGGFFLAVSLPFEFTEGCLQVCADQYGVICSPMRYFSAGSDWNNTVRLSFSYALPEEIERGIQRLSRFVESRIQ